MQYNYQDILDFWFAQQMPNKWFNVDDDLDNLITDKYLNLWQDAKDGEYKHWQDNAFGILALIIVLDQLPLNMFRNHSVAYSTEHIAIDLTKNLLNNSFEKNYTDMQKLFAFLPLMHSENIHDQSLSISLFEKHNLDTTYATHHYSIVKRFGRFPHRNKALGRTSSKEELEYLKSKEAFLGDG